MHGDRRIHNFKRFGNASCLITFARHRCEQLAFVHTFSAMHVHLHTGSAIVRREFPANVTECYRIDVADVPCALRLNFDTPGALCQRLERCGTATLRFDQFNELLVCRSIGERGLRRSMRLFEPRELQHLRCDG